MYCYCTVLATSLCKHCLGGWIDWSIDWLIDWLIDDDDGDCNDDDDDDDDDDVLAPNPVQVVDDIINSVLDDMFPAEKAASDVISSLLDQIMTTVNRQRGVYCFCV